MGHIQEWAKKVKWEDRVKAVCKPCWEIKYCPYGSLVEDFPLSRENTEKSCRIFGHDCPVYHVAEPFTETKELRKITRNIPRVTQFRVMKRENQICQVCGNSVKDENIEFDHIIPWSKGGSSDESNIRLLCSACNRKRGNNYEEEYLLTDFFEHAIEPSDVGIIDFIKEVAIFGHQFFNNEGFYPSEDDFAECLAEGEKTISEIKGAEYLQDLIDFFTSKCPSEISEPIFQSLKLRWGFIDGKVHRIKYSSNKLGLNPTDLIQVENDLMKKMGLRIKQNKKTFDGWLKK
ncbi:MAG: HNH endonuclease [Bacteroidales bacterium]|nr:HNH endonuclease [Bacteroidales bacterium]